ncbi:MAG: hypothetical protein HY315_09355 [Acidobacteria bacterium]|nr:hypothetical protein [Acidobacteriota bacterium]
MKRLLKICGLFLVLLVLGLVTLRITGLDPVDRGRPGLWLAGERVAEPVTDWSFADQVETIAVETRTPYFVPHSVVIYCATYNGQLYLFSNYARGVEFPSRFWNKNIVRDPRVRLKIGKQLFDLTLSRVADAAEEEAVLQRIKNKYAQFKLPPGGRVVVFRALPRTPA